MKKPLLLFCLLVLSIFNVTAQQIVWSELGGPNSLAANNNISCVWSDASGNIYAGGTFTNASGNRYIAKYDGNNWTELGGSNSLAANGDINAICSDAAGNIYAAGNFSNASANRFVAKFDGTSWTELGGLNSLAANSQIKSICVDAAGNVYAAGFFMNANAKRFVAKYDGTSWTELGGLNGLAANNPIYAIHCDAQGNIYAGGMFTNTAGKYFVAKYNGTSWSELGGLGALAANGVINTISSDIYGNIYAAGVFKNSNFKYYVAKYNPTGWMELGGPNALSANNVITSLATDAAGNMYAAGGFVNAQIDRYVAKYNGSVWSELGGQYGIGVLGQINTICTNMSGSVFAGGYFTNSNASHFVAYSHPCVPSTYTINQSICGNNSIVVNNKVYSKTGTYHDTLPNYTGCDSILTINLAVGLDSAKICMVTVDNNSTHNVVVWEKQAATKSSVDSFRIYRETATNTYSYIASVHRDSLSEYHDLAANPNSTSYKYKLTAIDTCGHLLPMSHFHNTIQLQNLGNGNFQWTSYQIENEANPVNYYIVSRDDNSTGNFQPISATIPGSNTTYTDVNFSSYPNASYRVAVNWSIACTPTKSTSTSYSNILIFGNAGIQSTFENTVHISPNPVTNEALISLSGAINNATIKVMNVTGQTLLELSKQSGKQFSIDLSKEAAGIYFVEIYEGEKVYHTKVVKQ